VFANFFTENKWSENNNDDKPPKKTSCAHAGPRRIAYRMGGFPKATVQVVASRKVPAGADLREVMGTAASDTHSTASLVLVGET
jgi:hypothetical protein